MTEQQRKTAEAIQKYIRIYRVMRGLRILNEILFIPAETVSLLMGNLKFDMERAILSILNRVLDMPPEEKEPFVGGNAYELTHDKDYQQAVLTCLGEYGDAEQPIESFRRAVVSPQGKIEVINGEAESPTDRLGEFYRSVDRLVEIYCAMRYLKYLEALLNAVAPTDETVGAFEQVKNNAVQQWEKAVAEMQEKLMAVEVPLGTDIERFANDQSYMRQIVLMLSEADGRARVNLPGLLNMDVNG